MECQKEESLINCKCTKVSCERRGMCCECVAHHRDSGQIPGCFFTSDVEQEYDRSISRFIAAHR